MLKVSGAALAVLAAGFGGYSYYLSKHIPAVTEQAILAWGDVEKEFRLRADLTPKLIDVVQSINDTQKPLIEELKAQQAAVLALPANPAAPKTPEGVRAFMHVQDGLSRQLGRIYDFLQYYPDRAREPAIRGPLDELEKRESAIAVARRSYSGSVAQLNMFLTTAPHSWIAGKLDPKPVPLVESFEVR